MQEPQYRAPEVRKLLDAVAHSRVPCMSIMNMPPHAYLKRLPGLDASTLRECYTDASVWDGFDPATITLASPDPQAFRPPEEPLNVLQVSLPTNFKVARFESDAGHGPAAPAGSGYPGGAPRGGRRDAGAAGEAARARFGVRAAGQVVHAADRQLPLRAGRMRRAPSRRRCTPISRSRARVYEWVAELCRRMGADPADQVPFEKYANAATRAGQAVLGGTRPVRRRPQHRTRRPGGAERRQAARHAKRRGGPDRVAGGRPTGDEPQQSGLRARLSRATASPAPGRRPGHGTAPSPRSSATGIRHRTAPACARRARRYTIGLGVWSASTAPRLDATP